MMCNIPGFVALSSFDARTPTGHHSSEWKTLKAAIERKELAAFQDASSGRYYVHEQDSAALLSAAKEEKIPTATSAIERELSLLERIVASMERQEELLQQIISGQ
jgi:hypothetical protein